MALSAKGENFRLTTRCLAKSEDSELFMETCSLKGREYGLIHVNRLAEM